MTETKKDLVVRDVELDRYARLGQWLAASETGGDSPNTKGAAAALRLYYAAELGLPPLAAAELSVIKGRLFVQAKLLRALAVRHGYRVTRTPESNDKTCTAVLVEIKTGEVIGRTTFTIEQARAAGLVRPKSAWETHPARMLWARASKFVLDDYAPEVTLGLGTEDEAAEIEGRPATTPPGGPTAAPDDPLDLEAEELPFGEPEPEMLPVQRAQIVSLCGKHKILPDELLLLASDTIDRQIQDIDELTFEEARQLVVRLELWQPDPV